MKTRTIIIASVSTIATCGIAYLLYRKGQKAETETTTASNSNSDATTEAAASFPLQYNSRGAEVKKLQTALNVLLADTAKCGEELPQYNNQEITALQVDGIFGVRTRKVCQWHFWQENRVRSQLQSTVGSNRITPNHYGKKDQTMAHFCRYRSGCRYRVLLFCKTKRRQRHLRIDKR